MGDDGSDRPDRKAAERSVTVGEPLMRATYRALQQHGYVDLSIQRIADEFDKSKSLIYYHYDDKDALLLEFLDYMRERFTAETADGGDDDSPIDRLWALYDYVNPSEIDDERRNFHVALYELRTKAPHSTAYRQRFTRMDERIRERIVAILEDGIEAEVFRDVDPEQTAEHVLSVLHGVMLAGATTDMGERRDAHRRAFRDYLESHLLANGTSPES